MADTPKIAIVGTGVMGTGIVTNFLKNGYSVYVWNRTKEKLRELEKNGAKPLETPKQGAMLADIVFEVTANDESSRSVWLADDGILAGARNDSVLITSATLSAEWAVELGRECEKRHRAFFDMPMTGGRAGAETGKLVLLVGGDEKKLEELKPTLAAISQKTLYFGRAGEGTKFKLLLNMLQAIHIVGFGEVMKIAQEQNMDIKAVGDALAERPGGITTGFAWRDYQKSPDPVNFSVKWITKDLGYAKALAGEENLPLLADVLTRYQEAVKKGLGDNDWTIVAKDA